MIKRIVKAIIQPGKTLSFMVCRIRSYWYSRKIDEGGGKIVLSDPWLRVKIEKEPGSKWIVKGKFRISSHIGGTAPVVISLRSNSLFQIDGDFIIGQGVRIAVYQNAELYFGGRKNESDSGITADTLIMVYRKIRIGYDFICSWNVFISDSDWHRIDNQKHNLDVEIGNKVWIANNCSILKGSKIADGSIVASHSKVINKDYPPEALLAGTPAKMIKTGVTWSRDI